jgi:hypothetical protein
MITIGKLNEISILYNKAIVYNRNKQFQGWFGHRIGGLNETCKKMG